MNVDTVCVNKTRVRNTSNSRKILSYSNNCNFKDLSDNADIFFKSANIKDVQKAVVRGEKIDLVKSLMSQVSTQFLKDSGINKHPTVIFEDLYLVHGLCDPIDIKIIFDPKIVNSYSQNIDSKGSKTESTLNKLFKLSIHESQHHAQAVSESRIQGRQNEFKEIITNYISMQKELIPILKKRNVYDDALEKFQNEPNNAEKVEVIKKQRAILIKALENEEKRVNRFNFEKTWDFYNEIIKEKGYLKKGSYEENKALKYLEADKNHSNLLLNFLSEKHPETKNFMEKYFPEIDNLQELKYKVIKGYRESFKEVNANVTARKKANHYKNLFSEQIQQLLT